MNTGYTALRVTDGSAGDDSDPEYSVQSLRQPRDPHGRATATMSGGGSAAASTTAARQIHLPTSLPVLLPMRIPECVGATVGDEASDLGDVSDSGSGSVRDDDSDFGAYDREEPPPLPPILPMPTPEQLESRIKGRHVHFDAQRYMWDAWSLVQRNMRLCLLLVIMYASVWLLWQVIAAGVWSLISGRSFDAFIFLPFHGDAALCAAAGTQCTTYVNAVMFSFVAGWLERALLHFPAWSSFFYMIFNAMRATGVMHMGDACFGWLTSGRYFCALFLLSSVYYISSQVLFLFFLLPGVYFAVVTIFCVPLHQEHRHLGLRALVLSAAVVHKYFCSVTGLLLLVILLQVLGAAMMGVGLLLTLPTAGAALCFCYHHLIGVNGCPLVGAPVPTPIGSVHPASRPPATAGAGGKSTQLQSTSAAVSAETRGRTD